MVNVRVATQDDCADVFQWRNDDLTRAMSQQASLVPWENHTQWFAAILANDKQMLVICETTSPCAEKIAVVRFDLNDAQTEAQLSINLNPQMRGKRYATPCLKSSIRFLSKHVPTCSAIAAKVKNINTASLKSLEGAGFIKTGAENEYTKYTLSL